MPSSRQPIVWCASSALVILTLLTYSRVYDSQFVPMDDSLHIVENPHFSPLSWQGLGELWKRPYGDIYVPLSYSFFAAEAWLSQHFGASSPTPFNPWVFHLGNVLIHAVCALLVFAILRQLVADVVASLLGAALFVVHPVQVESVAWISETRGTLAACLCFAAIYQFLRFRGGSDEPVVVSTPVLPSDEQAADSTSIANAQEPSSNRAWLHYSLATAAYLLALLAKPSAVAVPAMLLAIDVIWYRRNIWKSLACLAWWILPALALIWITREAQAARINSHVFIPEWWQRPFVMLDTLTFYLWKLLVPIGLGIDYGRTPNTVLASSLTYLTALVPIAIAMALFLLPQRRKWLTAGALFVVAILPVSGLLPFIAQDVSTVGDRFMYLPMLGPAVALAVLASLPRMRSIRMEIAIALLILAILSIRQTGFWHDQQTVFERGLEINPQSWPSIGYVAESAFQQGEFTRAEELFQRGTKVTPGRLGPWNNLGAFYANTGRPVEAEQAFEQAVELAGNDPTPSLHLAMIQLQLGKNDQVVGEMTELLKAQPELGAARNYLAVALFNLERYGEAAQQWEMVLATSPRNADLHAMLGETYAKLTDYVKAREHFRTVLQLRPEDPRAAHWLREIEKEAGSSAAPTE